MTEPDLTAELDAAEEIVTGEKPYSEHVAVSRMTLSGGQSYEVITVSQAFLVAALEDARSWCHEMEGTSSPTPARLVDYDAALAVIREECAADTPARTLILGVALESSQDPRLG